MIVDEDPLTRLFTIIAAGELAIMLALLVLLRLRPGAMSAPTRAYQRITERVSSSCWRSCALVFVVSLGVCALMAMADRPVPRIHDEFSYLLAGETFSAGRVAGEQLPVWRTFETPHVVVQPVYASKYPPAQGLTLALGMLLGAPIIGVWLSTAAMSASVCWALRAWTRPNWALAAGMLVALTPGVIAWWGHTYWGGSVAALAGALLFGAFRRIWDRPDLTLGRGLTLGVTLGFSLVLLACSRPFEGCIASLPVGGLLAWRLLASRRRSFTGAFRLALPTLAVLAAGALAIASLNRATTGDPTKMPYALHTEQYSATPMFLFQERPEPPEYSNAALREFYVGYEATLHRKHDRFGRMLELSVWKLAMLWGFYVGPALVLAPFLAFRARAPRSVRERWLLFASLEVALVVSCSLLVPWLLPHYLAPLTVLAAFVLIEGIRAGLAQRSPLLTQAIAAGLGARCLIVLALPFLPLVVRHLDPADGTGPWSRWRAETIASLSAEGGRHLVFVDPRAPWLTSHHAVAYNPASIDDAPVLFGWTPARAKLPEISRAFPDRSMWRVVRRDDAWTLVQYPRQRGERP